MLETLSDSEANSHITGPLPRDYIRRIYKARACINERNGNLINGFDKLLAGLDALTEAEVTLHSLEMPDQTYIIFTNAACTLLIGVLEIPHRTADGRPTGDICR